ncbi:MAG: hypothetical protein ACRCUY_13820 [Thermoguttaceae bacterium]
MSATLEDSVKLLIEGLAESNRTFAEANRKFAEENRKFSIELRDFKEENRIGFEELRESQLKTERENRIGFEKLRESHQKTEEANRIGFEELRKNHRRIENSFNTKWGRLVEALVNNQVIPLLRERGIPVHQTSQRIHGMTPEKRNYEFDIIAENGDTIVVIEVKTTLRVDDVREFLDELNNFKNWLPRYSNMKVYGAVAFLHETSEASSYAAKSGLFTILATGSSASITNPQEFKPQAF